MSFRYTNQLIGVMKHRILLEKSRRSIVQRVFTGRCDGVTVKYSAYGRVLAIEVAPEHEVHFKHPDGSIHTERLCTCVKAAVYSANRQLVEAKEEAYRQSISGNEQLKATDNFSLWFESSASHLSPLPQQMLSHEVGATEWARHIRRDSPDSPLTIADTHPVLKPALMALEDERLVLSEQKKDMAENEREFWRRVELIRKGQTSTVPGQKRRYKDESPKGTAAAADTAHKDKVVLKFVH